LISFYEKIAATFIKLLFITLMKSCICSLGGIVKCAHEVIVSVEEVLLVVAKGDLAAAVLGEEHGLALLDSAGAELAVVKGAAGADSDHNTEVQLLLLALRQEDATLGLGEGLGLLDEDAVHQGTQLLECDHLYSQTFLEITNK
jgi:hypothetical protein